MSGLDHIVIRLHKSGEGSGEEEDDAAYENAEEKEDGRGTSVGEKRPRTEEKRSSRSVYWKVNLAQAGGDT